MSFSLHSYDFFIFRKYFIFFLDNLIVILIREIQNKAEVNVKVKIVKCGTMEVMSVEIDQEWSGEPV